MQAKAKALQKESETIQAEADRRYAQEKPTCYKKVLVSACLEDAEVEHRLSSQKARKLRTQGNDIDRKINAREQAVKNASYAPEAERKADAVREQQKHQTQLEDFAKRAGERAQRQQARTDRDTEAKGKLQQSAVAQQEQIRRKAEAAHRAQESYKSTAAYQNAQKLADKRQQELNDKEQKLKARTDSANPPAKP